MDTQDYDPENDRLGTEYLPDEVVNQDVVVTITSKCAGVRFAHNTYEVFLNGRTDNFTPDEEEFVTLLLERSARLFRDSLDQRRQARERSL
jgi:hypothetical protein